MYITNGDKYSRICGLCKPDDQLETGELKPRGSHFCRSSMLLLMASLVWPPPAPAFDHSYQNYAAALSECVREGRVDYARLCRERAGLDQFLGEASVLSFEEYQTFSREQKMAFMMNLYNAGALALVCNHPGMKSIEELKGVFRDAWSVRFIRLFDRTVGLAQLLHDILRPEFKDTRIHFALVTACKSDPELLNVPYRAEILNQHLDRQTEKFMTERPDANRYENGTLYLSPKSRWDAVDFGRRGQLLRFAQRYFAEVTEQKPVRYTSFDWSLNAK